MFKLDHKLSPDDFIQTFFEANKSDHQRPPHPWETLFRGGKCTKDQLQGWAKERYYFDVEHGLIRKEILKKYANTKELQEDCINAQLMKNNMRRVIADAIYMA
jgi:pyrroloquinoline quinone (PQQ) biosynthesis protein C